MRSLVLYCNVLVWNPTIGTSHVRLLGKIADLLAADGHNVTIVSPIIDPLVNMVGHKSSITQIPYHSKYMAHEEFSKIEIKGSTLWDMPFVEGRSVTISDYEMFVDSMRMMCRGVLEDGDFLNLLRSFNFDVAIHEVYEMSSVAIFELIGVKRTVVVSAIGTSPFTQHIAGLPAQTSFVPGTYSTYSDDMTFWERLDNFKLDLQMRYYYYIWERNIWKLANNISSGFPSLSDLLQKKTGVVLSNVNDFTETPRPTASIIRRVGGLTVPKPKPVDQNIDKILNERSQNVYFSMGSFALSKDMPKWLKQDITNAFANFPNTTFIWKYEDDSDAELLTNHPNIHRMTWAPQVDLLGDRRLSLFITHAGMNSALEATFYGKPLVAVPLFSDQILNAKSLEKSGLAVVINRRALNEHSLTAAIKQVLDPKASYSRKAEAAARYLHGQAEHARAEVLRWVKLVAEDGQMEHLLLHSRNMSFIQYHNIDVLMYLLIQISLVFYIVTRFVRLVLSRVVALRREKIE
ncbi:hypothetical protein Q1695_011774 [Nippostrongylus brasiliensis]|nr:hypothetical protein Q1695_011774 [Nippostrongylus brasiliensis]